MKWIYLLLSVLTSTSAFGHVLLEAEAQSTKYFFYRSGEYLFRYRCPYTTSNPTPSACTLSPEVQKNALAVYKILEERVLQSLPEVEARRSDLLLTLTNIDRKIDEIISSNPTPPDDEEVKRASKALQSARDAESKAFSSVTEIQKEVDAIETRLRSTYSEDLMAQSLKLKQSLSNAKVAHQKTQLDVESTRARYIDFCSENFDDALLLALKSQRRTKAEYYIGATGAIKSLQEHMANMRFFIKDFVEDQSFTYDILARELGEDAYPFVKAYELINAFRDTP